MIISLFTDALFEAASLALDAEGEVWLLRTALFPVRHDEIVNSVYNFFDPVVNRSDKIDVIFKRVPNSF